MAKKCDKCRRPLLLEESGVYCGDCLDDMQAPRRGMDSIDEALQTSQARIADLEGALRQIRELTEDYEHNQQLSEVWYMANNVLTPEGGGK